MIYIIKRDDRKVEFNESKITNALLKAAEGTKSNISVVQLNSVRDLVLKTFKKQRRHEFTVEEIQDIVVSSIAAKGHKKLAQEYNNYRRERSQQREIKSDLMKVINKIGVETDRDNANVGNNFSAKLLRIASEANK
jgi:ribonucleoside-triphosphate reductase